MSYQHDQEIKEYEEQAIQCDINSASFSDDESEEKRDVIDDLKNGSADQAMLSEHDSYEGDNESDADENSGEQSGSDEECLSSPFNELQLVYQSIEMQTTLPNWRSCCSYTSSEGQFEGGNESQKEDQGKESKNSTKTPNKKREKSQSSEQKLSDDDSDKYKPYQTEDSNNRVDEEEKSNLISASFSATRTPAITAVKDDNQIKQTIDIAPNSLFIPPPENLIKKSMVVTEEARTGASIAFEKI